MRSINSIVAYFVKEKKAVLELDQIGMIRYRLGMRTLLDHRKAAGLTQAELAEAVGSNQGQIQKLESGQRKLTREWAERLAPHLNTSAQALLFNGELPKAPIVGHVGAGMQVYSERDSDPEYVDVPPNSGPVEVVVVRGDSMWPVYRDGDRLIFEAISRAVEDMVGKECVVELADGRTLVKTIRKLGEEFVLESFNAPTIMGVVITSAWPVRWIERK